MAFRTLFDQWQPVLAGYIFRITRSRELAAEILQDVFLKIWMSREALAEVDNFKHYLFIVSRNHAINALKKAMREFERMKDLSRELEARQFTDSFSTVDSTETILYTLIDEAIENLPPRQKEVFLLHRHERLTYLQIAEKLNIGRESVKTHLGLAIKSISKYLTERAGTLLILITALKNFFLGAIPPFASPGLSLFIEMICLNLQLPARLIKVQKS